MMSILRFICRNLSVLLVDDGEENRDLMSVILEEAGTTFATAENGLEAMELANQREVGCDPHGHANARDGRLYRHSKIA